MTPKSNNLVACRECDALQRWVPLAPGGVAECTRCGAELFRDKRRSLERTLALILAAAIVFLCANTFPLMELDSQGLRSTSTLLGTVIALRESGYTSIALVVLVTTIVMPLLQLSVALYILLPLRLGVLPPHLPDAVRIVGAVWRWGMVEVFLLGAMVSLVKLTQVGSVTPGWALYMIGAYVLLLAAAVAAFEPRALWARVEALSA